MAPKAMPSQLTDTGPSDQSTETDSVDRTETEALVGASPGGRGGRAAPDTAGQCRAGAGGLGWGHGGCGRRGGSRWVGAGEYKGVTAGAGAGRTG